MLVDSYSVASRDVSSSDFESFRLRFIRVAAAGYFSGQRLLPSLGYLAPVVSFWFSHSAIFPAPLFFSVPEVERLSMRLATQTQLADTLPTMQAQLRSQQLHIGVLEEQVCVAMYSSVTVVEHAMHHCSFHRFVCPVSLPFSSRS